MAAYTEEVVGQPSPKDVVELPHSVSILVCVAESRRVAETLTAKTNCRSVCNQREEPNSVEAIYPID